MHVKTDEVAGNESSWILQARIQSSQLNWRDKFVELTQMLAQNDI